LFAVQNYFFDDLLRLRAQNNFFTVGECDDGVWRDFNELYQIGIDQHLLAIDPLHLNHDLLSHINDFPTSLLARDGERKRVVEKTAGLRSLVEWTGPCTAGEETLANFRE
jgi:hypothetical protein